MIGGMALFNGCIAEMEEVRAGLRMPGLSNGERATLRLRADVIARLIVAQEKLARLPEKPAAGAPSLLDAYK